MIDLKDIKLIVFDMAGTTVFDNNDVHYCLQKALANEDVMVSIEEINPLMGYPKPLAIKMLMELKNIQTSEKLVKKIHSDFVDFMIDHYKSSPAIREKDNAKEVFAKLKMLGIKVAIDTGFSRPIANTIFKRLNWIEGIDFDTSVTSDEVRQGRPYPYMIFHAMENLEIASTNQVMKVGDTSSDVLQGTNAGCKYVVGITTGAFSKSEIEKYPHTHLMASLQELFG